MKLFGKKTLHEKNIENTSEQILDKLSDYAIKFNVPYKLVKARYFDQLESLQLTTTKGSIQYENIENATLVRILCWLRRMEEEAPPVRPPPAEPTSHCKNCDMLREPADVFCAYCGWQHFQKESAALEEPEIKKYEPTYATNADVMEDAYDYSDPRELRYYPIQIIPGIPRGECNEECFEGRDCDNTRHHKIRYYERRNKPSIDH
ncbi:hypothetical protein LCGC14_0267720 [marine sediment metagenome]|uniref:Uncharacterized protein n=1 Tax=marine sediment metagenome TaxID=412755 RepID=A0A0F9WKQ2_9ZZZZ